MVKVGVRKKKFLLFSNLQFRYSRRKPLISQFLLFFHQGYFTDGVVGVYYPQEVLRAGGGPEKETQGIPKELTRQFEYAVTRFWTSFYPTGKDSGGLPPSTWTISNILT